MKRSRYVKGPKQDDRLTIRISKAMKDLAESLNINLSAVCRNAIGAEIDAAMAFNEPSAKYMRQLSKSASDKLKRQMDGEED